MRILFLDAYFEPEQIAFTHLEHDLLEGLVNAGHEVQIVCPTPTRGISHETREKYKEIKSEDLWNGHVHVMRFSAPREGRNPLIRALRYFWCNLRTCQIGKKQKEIDAVFCNSTPPTQGWIAGKVAKKLKVPFVYSLQDVFPDSLVNTGMTKEGSSIWKIGRIIENRTYSLADRIIVISNGFKRNVLAKGVPEEKVAVVSNWIDLHVVKPVNRQDNPLFDELGIARDRFVVVYAGNLGEAQGAEVILDTAKKLLSEEGIQFVIFGGGAKYQEIKNRIEDEKLKNIRITGFQPQERVSEVYSMGDVALITCRKGTGNAGMPSKTWSIMACDTPIIAAIDQESELAGIIADSHAGAVIAPEDSDAMKKAIEEAFTFAGPAAADGRAYAIENVSKEKCVGLYIRILQTGL